MHVALAESAQTPSAAAVIQPSICDPSAEISVRRTQALSPNVTTSLSPTFQKFSLENKIAIVTGYISKFLLGESANDC